MNNSEQTLVLAKNLPSRMLWFQTETTQERGTVMVVDFTFLHVDTSEALMEHMQQKLEKLLKFEMKPMETKVVFTMQKHDCIVDVNIVEGRKKFKAQASCEDFYRAADQVVNKLVRQLSKDKHRVKEHRNVAASHYGKLAMMTDEMSVDFHREPPRKVG